MKVKFKELLSWLHTYSSTKQMDLYNNISLFLIKEGNKLFDDLTELYNGDKSFIPALISGNNDLKDHAKMIVDKVVERFGDCYVLYDPYPYEDYSLVKRVDVFVSMILNYYKKYSSLLSIYEAEKDHLMQGLKTEITGSNNKTEIGSGSNSANSKSRTNDTPQDIIVDDQPFDDTQHVSLLQMGESSGSSSSRIEDRATNSQTEYKDRDSIIAKLDEIDKKYNDVLYSWSNTFKKYFIMVGE